MKERLLKSIDEILPYPRYDWYGHQVKGEPPRFLGPLSEEAACCVSVNGSIEKDKGASLCGSVDNANPNWVISGVDLRVPEGYSPSSVHLPLCVLPGERATFNVRLMRHGVRRSRYNRPKWISEEIDDLQSIGIGHLFGCQVSQPSSKMLDIVPWSQ